MVSRPATGPRQSAKKSRRKISSASPRATIKRKLDAFDFVEDVLDPPKETKTKHSKLSLGNKTTTSRRSTNGLDKEQKEEEEEEEDDDEVVIIEAKKNNSSSTKSAKATEKTSTAPTTKRRPTSVGSIILPATTTSKLSTGNGIQKENGDDNDKLVEVVTPRQAAKMKRNRIGSLTSKNGSKKSEKKNSKKVSKKEEVVEEEEEEEVEKEEVKGKKGSSKSSASMKNNEDEVKKKSSKKSSTKQSDEIQTDTQPRRSTRSSIGRETLPEIEKKSVTTEKNKPASKKMGRKSIDEKSLLSQDEPKQTRSGSSKKMDTNDNIHENKPEEKKRRSTSSATTKATTVATTSKTSSPRKKTTSPPPPSSVEFIKVDKFVSPEKNKTKITSRYPTVDDVEFDEKNEEEILLRQITNAANTERQRQRAPPKILSHTPKPNEMLNSFVPTTFSSSPSPGAEASCDEVFIIGSSNNNNKSGGSFLSSLAERKINGRRKSKVDAMVLAEKKRLTGNLQKIGENHKTTFPPVTSGYASIISPPRNFSKLLSPQSILKRQNSTTSMNSNHNNITPTPRRRTTFAPSSSSLQLPPERGNIMDLSPISMKTARSLDMTPMNQSLFNLLQTTAPRVKSSFVNKKNLSPARPLTFPVSPQPASSSSSSMAENQLSLDLTESFPPSSSSSSSSSSVMGPPPSRRSTRVLPPAPPPPPTEPAPEPLGPEEALAEAVKMMKRKKPVQHKKRKTKTAEAADTERATKEESEVATIKSFFEDLDAEPTDAFLEFD